MRVSQYGFKLQKLFIGLLAYADDVVLLEESLGNLKDMFLKLHRCAVKVGLQCNEESVHDC